MKFLLVTALIATASAAPGTVCTKASDCATSTECCGTATKDNAYTDGATANLAKDGVVRSVCNTSSAKAWVETLTGSSATLYTSTSVTSGKAGYVFACKATVGSIALKASVLASAVMAASVYA